MTLALVHSDFELRGKTILGNNTLIVKQPNEMGQNQCGAVHYANFVKTINRHITLQTKSASAIAAATAKAIPSIVQSQVRGIISNQVVPC